MSDFILGEFLPYQLAVLSVQISREFSEVYRKEFGISAAEWRILAHLSQAEGPLSVREVFTQVALDKSKVSRASDRLQKMGLVVKTQSGSDRRLVELSLSPTGWDVVQKLIPLAKQYEQKLIGRLGTKGPDFRTALDIIRASLVEQGY